LLEYFSTDLYRRASLFGVKTGQTEFSLLKAQQILFATSNTMRILFSVLFLALVLVAAKADQKKSSHFLMGTPWYSEFLEEDDAAIENPKMKPSRRKDTTDKPKEVSAKKMKNTDKKEVEEKTMKSRRRKNTEDKPKEVSSNKVKKTGKEVEPESKHNITTLRTPTVSPLSPRRYCPPTTEKSGWFFGMNFEDLTTSLE